MKKTPWGGTRPTGLVEPQGPQERVQRHAVEQLADFAPMVQILDVPVPQMVDQLVDILKLLDTAIPEQVIAVPKIPQDSIPHRAVFEPQLAEQLVEVLTPVTHVGRSVLGCGAYEDPLVEGWHPHTQWDPPEGYTATPGRYRNTGHRDAG